jgi:hypothetical protein
MEVSREETTGTAPSVARKVDLHEAPGIVTSVIASAIALCGVGLLTSLFNGRTPWLSAARQVVFGCAAAAVTYGSVRCWAYRSRRSGNVPLYEKPPRSLEESSEYGAKDHAAYVSRIGDGTFLLADDCARVHELQRKPQPDEHTCRDEGDTHEPSKHEDRFDAVAWIGHDKRLAEPFRPHRTT